jgi:hypothetical protein
MMRVVLALAVVALFAAPAFAADKIECSQIPHAQAFVDGLKPGPNTKAAQAHLDAAKNAKSDQDCVAELGKVNYYAKRSAAADARLASAASARNAASGGAPGDTPNAKPKKVKLAKAKPASAVKCADTLHQDRPGGNDYKGPPVAGCKPVL